MSDLSTLDLLLKGGRVIDPANGIDAPMDVGIHGSVIARVAADIPSSDAATVVDVSGHIVTPGILDIHTHVYPSVPSAVAYVGALNADAHLLASGVTTTVDAGTTGWKDFPHFKARYIDKSQVRILAFINIADGGMVDATSEQVMRAMQPKIAAALAEAYPEVIVGIKTAHYWTKDPWDAEHLPWASVERAVEAGELCGKPVMVDFWPRPPERSYPDLILKKLRPGDIHTHVFAQQFPIVNAEGKVYDYMFQARERGVIFDLGHGAGSFWFRNAVPALADGFPPDSISTDLHMGNINGPVVSMLTTMSKYLSMGMPLQEVIFRSTVTPAREIRRPELGTLSVGAEADVAVFKRHEGRFGFTDCGRAKIVGSQKLECAMTVRAGKIVYDPTGLSMPEWQHAPAAYWKLPDL
ncbi:MAG TPA: amidohydrolase/deacetylase family metallohydrolase [Anaerolineae bacterium]|mgnify:CR=1 FL=1|nr:amidohydrolase/deacetylase family metallohydrolase [Anaerolineae bacterium]HQI83769.1 amidohydrolase/deacetylase family metallohydrolase [Anaerolineae bacterium]